MHWMACGHQWVASAHMIVLFTKHIDKDSLYYTRKTYPFPISNF